eukprot:scaffold764_cov248-Pinguiococcus_pyrenoidosus.AAC.9
MPPTAAGASRPRVGWNHRCRFGPGQLVFDTRCAVGPRNPGPAHFRSEADGRRMLFRLCSQEFVSMPELSGTRLPLRSPQVWVPQRQNPPSFVFDGVLIGAARAALGSELTIPGPSLVRYSPMVPCSPDRGGGLERTGALSPSPARRPPPV